MKDLSIVNIESGEKKSIEEATNEEISMYLGNLKAQKKKLEALEKKIKQYVEANRNLEFKKSESGVKVAKFQDHTIRVKERWSFDQETFDKKARDDEKEIVKIAEEVKKQYQKVTKYLEWK